MDGKTIGEIAYDGYLAASGGKSLVSGVDLPPFDQLVGSIQAAWESAAQAVAASVGRADAR